MKEDRRFYERRRYRNYESNRVTVSRTDEVEEEKKLSPVVEWGLELGFLLLKTGTTIVCLLLGLIILVDYIQPLFGKNEINNQQIEEDNGY